MSIKNINIETYQQDLIVSKKNKHFYGEIRTNIKLVKKMFSLFPKNIFKNPDLKWLDPCAGKGIYMIVLYKLLFESLQYTLPKEEERHSHIITRMIFMIEINNSHRSKLHDIFGNDANIIITDYLNTNIKADIIIGNPPFNIINKIKVPTNNTEKKALDGKSIWQSFINHSLNNLSDEGYLNMITPAIWMKEDHSMYNIITKNKILNLIALDSNKTTRLFNGEAQTPTCYFLLQKTPSDNIINITDITNNMIIQYPVGKSLPLSSSRIFHHIKPLIAQWGSIKVLKTSWRPPRKGYFFGEKRTKKLPYPNIHTVVLKNKNEPCLIKKYTNKPGPYFGKPKLILAHKMYGFSYYDKSGEFGISNRDNYIILNKTHSEFIKINSFLNTKFARHLMDATRYRMKYLEKYYFDLIPNIAAIPDFPEVINNINVMKYFQTTHEERFKIESRKDYLI